MILTLDNDGSTQGFDALIDIINFRCRELFTSDNKTVSPHESSFIQRAANHPAYALINSFEPSERLVLLVALANQLYPQLWSTFTKAVGNLEPEKYSLDTFGLVSINGGAYLQATIGTVLFLLEGDDHSRQKSSWQLFLPKATLRTSSVLVLPEDDHLPPIDAVLTLEKSYQHQLLTGEAPQPQYSSDFPATQLTTTKTWDDLILNEKTATLIGQARKWVRYYARVNIQPGVHRGQGYRLMMSGPSGTGKTMTAALLGQDAGKPVYRIDISNIVDKYVGETSKKLRRIFEVAEAQDWILFFDEGDALFGKRSEGGQSSNERYANQEVSYLLYKMEEYQGMIFLATNNRHAIDSAFRRRFDSLIKFQETDDYTRQRLWKHFFEGPGYLQLDPAITQADWRELAANGQVSAAWIEKFYAYCVMQTTHAEDTYISAQDMQEYLYWFGCEHGFFEKETGHLFQKKYQH